MKISWPQHCQCWGLDCELLHKMVQIGTMQEFYALLSFEMLRPILRTVDIPCNVSSRSFRFMSSDHFGQATW